MVVGGLRVATGDGRPLRISSRKAQAVLACLALEPGAPLGREFLASLLWEDADPELARASLRQALATLRKALPDGPLGPLKADADSVWLDAAAVQTDLGRFRAALKAGSFDAAAHEVPVDDLLAGLDAKSLAFEQWLDLRRSAFRRQRIEALKHVAARCAAAADLEGQQAALERLLALDPVDERAHRELMDVLARQGRWTDALRQYRSCRDVLRRELDVATEPATDALYRDVLRRRRALDPSATEDADGAVVLPGTDERPVSAAPPLLRDAVVLCVRMAAGDADLDDVELAGGRSKAFARQVSIEIERYGGRVETTGAAEALAVFGLDAVTGNEAERAVRAALALSTSSPDGLVIACGLESGQVLKAEPGDAVLGGRAVVNARELARSAGIREVLVSHGLLGRLRDGFEHEATPRPGLPTACRVRLQSLAPTARAPRLFVGRRAELSLLTSLLERVASSARGRVVVVRANRASASRQSSRRSCARPKDNASPRTCCACSTSARPLSSVRSPHSRRVSSGSIPARRPGRRWQGGRCSLRGSRATRGPAFVLALVGATEADAASSLAAMDNATRERGRISALQRLVQRNASTPLLIVVEDIHWAEKVELAAIADLAAALAAHPVLFALSVRADDDPLDPAWRARLRGCPMTTLDLAPLDHEECIELAAAHGDWPAELLERCVDLAAGHPLFLEQLLRASASGESSLPGSVRALLLRRVERLDPGTQQALQSASILGHRFALEALRHLLGAPGFDVASLEASGLVTIDGDERRFAHALIRDAVYESLVGSTRRDLHRRAAAWYAPRDAGLSADHLAAANDPAASAAYGRAAVEQLQSCRLERALVYAERCSELARDPKDHCAARATLGDVQFALGRASEACASYRGAIELAVDGEGRARGWLGLAAALRILDRHDEALAALDHAARDLDAGDHRRQARLWTLRGNLHFPRGELEDCLHSHRRALEHAREAESLEDVVRAFGGLGDAQYQRGRLRSAAAEFGRCVDLAEQHRLATLRLAYLPMVAVCQLYMGEIAAALATCETARMAATDSRDRRAELLAVGIAASAQFVQAEFAISLAQSERCVVIARELGARRFEAENRVLRGLALLHLGEDGRARTELEQAAEAARSACPTYCGPWAFAALALAAHEDEPLARGLLAEGAGLLARGCVSHNYLEFHHYAMEACGRWRDWNGVQAHADALEAYTRDEPLLWAETIIAAHRAIAQAAAAPGPESQRAVVSARDRARELRFLMLVPQLDRAAVTPGA